MWARIEEDLVAEITSIDPTERFHESLIWIACDDSVMPGWLKVEGGFVEPPVSDADEETIEREWRTVELMKSEWLVMRHRDELDMVRPQTLSEDAYTSLLAYRQQLRDWPLADQFPRSAHRPLAPDWLATQVR